MFSGFFPTSRKIRFWIVGEIVSETLVIFVGEIVSETLVIFVGEVIEVLDQKILVLEKDAAGEFSFQLEERE